MSEQTLLPAPDEPHAAPVSPPDPARSHEPRKIVPWLYGLGFLILAGAIFYLWQNPPVPTEAVNTATALQAVQQHLGEIDARLSRLEQRPVPDIGRLTQRLDGLEGRIGDQVALASRMDTLSGRIESLSRRDQTSIDAAKQQLDTLASRMGALDANASNLEAVSKRLNRLARLQEASIALTVGRPVGDLANAPDALARYAHAPPPTEADLRLGFPKAKEAALAARQPDPADAPFVNRVWERAQSLVTIRRGDEIVVGNPSATILGQAQTALDAGDMAGAAAAVETLKGPPRKAMDGWLSQAKSLLGARAALAEMADQA